jgi:acetolactate synthase-1/3 small subunit
MRHIISVLVENRFGVLARVAGLFSGRGYNIESLSVGVTNNPEHSTMTIVTSGEEKIIEQIVKQLRKLINVIKVRDITATSHIEREMLLIRVKANSKNRPDLFSIVNTFRAKIVSLNSESAIIEITGVQEKNIAFLNVLEHYGIVELVRTGSVAIARDTKNNGDHQNKGV